MASGAPAPALPSAPPSSPGNWFQEWREKTPLITRWLTFITVPLSIVSLLVTPVASALSVTPQVFLSGHLWRIFTAPLVAQGFFALLFCLLFLFMQAPTLERAQGSAAFLFYIIISSVIINTAYAGVTALLVSVMSSPKNVFGILSSSGLIPFLLFAITASSLSDPAGTTPFCCTRIPNRIFPFFLVGIFCLVAMAVQVDLLLAVALGVAEAFGLVRCLFPSKTRLRIWESELGLFTRFGLTRKPGYALIPDTGVQAPGEPRTSAFAGFSLFDPARRAAAGPGGRPAGGGGAPAAPASGNTGFHMFRAGASAPTRTEASFTGAGNVLGGSSSAPPRGTGSSTNGTTGATTRPETADVSAMRAAALARLQGVSQAAAAKPAAAAATTASTAGTAHAPETSGNSTEDSAAAASDAEGDEESLLLRDKAHAPARKATKAEGRANAAVRSAPAAELTPQEKIARLLAMGATRPDAIKALADAGGDMEIAELLVISTSE